MSEIKTPVGRMVLAALDALTPRTTDYIEFKFAIAELVEAAMEIRKRGVIYDYDDTDHCVFCGTGDWHNARGNRHQPDCPYLDLRDSLATLHRRRFLPNRGEHK